MAENENTAPQNPGHLKYILHKVTNEELIVFFRDPAGNTHRLIVPADDVKPVVWGDGYAGGRGET